MNKNKMCINGQMIGDGYATYFIADIAANHDGDLSRAIDLIYLAAESGADAAKFQHFSANTIVSDKGFKSLVTKQSHQKNWQKSVYEVYQEASLNVDWNHYLKEACCKAGISFMTSPYSLNLVDEVDQYISAYKIGSGDITWLEIIDYIAKKNKPYILATGASKIEDVQRSVDFALQINPNLALLQCNTNYTASLENFKYIQLNVLKAYQKLYPEIVLGLSDHTLGHSTVLGAVALGASIIEKHFTDDIKREGPDHAFSMDPKSWREMVDRTRELENSLGDHVKKVEDNEKETVVLQRRSIRLKQNLDAGSILNYNDLIMLRPCPHDAIQPYELREIIGKKLTKSMQEGEYLTWTNLESV